MDDIVLENPELEMLKNNKKAGFDYRERRQDDWDENYTLYRDKVQVNRLTQRQSVNIPLMKTQLRSLMKDVDDMPVIEFENLDNNKEAEVFKNEYWALTAEENKFEIQDIVDKKQVFFFGRSFAQWQIMDGKVKMTVIDPEDILVSPYTYPTDIHSSPFLIHTHIFVKLSDLENDAKYDQKAVARLKEFYQTDAGIIKQADNIGMMERRNNKRRDMGEQGIDNPTVGETYVELSLHFVKRREGEKADVENWLYVEADNMEILMKDTEEKVIGKTKDEYFKTHYPYDSWADDIEIQDFWNDGIADTLRTPNKVVNAWFSQEVENRTLRNLGMNYYDSSVEGFTPPNVEPRAGGWYGLPGKPGDVYQKVDIPSLDGNLDAIEFLIGISEKSSGATANQQGAETQKQITLGEVKIAYDNAKERIKGMSKFYTQVWKERGEMFSHLVEAGESKLDAVTIFKKGRNTDTIYSRDITPADWRSELGYRCKVWSQADRNEQNTMAIEKIGAVVTNIPDNPKLLEIYKRKLLEFADLKPDEISAVMELEQQKMDAMMMQTQGGGIDPVTGQPIAPPMGGPGGAGQFQPPMAESGGLPAPMVNGGGGPLQA